MCDSCKSEVVEQDQLKELDIEDLQALLESQEPGEDVETAKIFFDPIGLSTENLAEDISFDEEEFNKGLKKGSYEAGLFTALINAGMDLESATTYILNTMNVKMNLEIAKIQSAATIEAAKHAQVAVEKQQL